MKRAAKGHRGRHARGSSEGRAGSARATERLRVETLAAGGSGLARREDGSVVLVAQSAPGDLVEAEVARGGRPDRGRILRVLEPGPDRIEPPCASSASCGGCDWMHLRAEARRTAYADLVRSAVAHALGLRPDELPPVRFHPAEKQLGYRTRARLFAKAERGSARIGYRAAGSHAIVPVSACMVLDPSIEPLVRDLPDVLAGARGEGDVSLSRGAGGRPAASVLWRGDLPEDVWRRLDERVASGRWAGARVLLEGAGQPACFGDPRAVATGADGEPLVIAAGSFAQPSDEGASLLSSRVAALAAGSGARPERAVELFAGSGTLTVALAREVGSLIAVERDADAVACLRQNLAVRNLSAKVVAADAESFAIPPAKDLVVLDPPRTGAREASRRVAASAARAAVYASCDPPTLARDLAVLAAAGLAVTDLELIELFPQTSHVETVVRLVRRRRGPRRLSSAASSAPLPQGASEHP